MRRIFFVLMIIIPQVSILAQNQIPFVQIPIDWLGVQQGLSQGFVSAIIQDKDGFMWFGTSDGLNKFDGYKVTVYRNDPRDSFSLADNMISGLIEDDQENIWIATRNKGLSIFDKRTDQFHPVRLKEVPAYVGIQSMHYHQHKLFLKTNVNALLYHIDSFRIGPGNMDAGKFMHLLFDYNIQQKNPALRMEAITGNYINWIRENQIWLLSADSIIRYEAMNNFNRWTTTGYSYQTFGLHKNERYYHFVVPDKRNTNIVYAFTDSYFQKLDMANTRVIETIDFDHSNQIGGFFANPSALPDGNLIFRKNEQLFHYNVLSHKLTEWPNELIKHGIICDNPCLSNDAITWFGTAGFGVVKSDQRKNFFHAHEASNSMSLYFLKDTKRVDYIPPQILVDMFGLEMSNIAQDQDGVYWAHSLSNRSVTSYNPRTQKINRLPDSNIDPYRRHIFIDKKNRLWVFADYGANKQYLYQINKLNGAHEREYKIPIGTTNNLLQFVRDLYSDDERFVYLATEKGLFRLNYQSTDSNNMWKFFQFNPSDTSSLSSNSLWCICPDPLQPSTYLWLGSTSSGLDRFDMRTGKCIHYSEADGLPNNVVYGILSDKANNLWMSTNKGLSCFNPATGSFRNFSSEDGLSCEEFNHFEYRKLKNGDLFFGGINGFTIFDPEEVLQKQQEVPIVFTGFAISNKPVHWNKTGDILDAPIAYAKTITLHPGQSIFTITFASLEYRSNQKKFYKYKLQGFDEAWTEPSTKNEATFMNLAPGIYTLLVTGTNTDGVWNAKGASVIIKVLPAWYQTWWFKVLLVTLLLSATYALYRFRIRQITKVQQFREKIARDLHDEIGSTLSSISLYGESAKMMLEPAHPLHTVLTKINQSTNAMMESMSDIVWAINTKNDKLDNLVNRMNVYALQAFDAGKCTVHFSSDQASEQLSLDMNDRKNVYLLFKEIIHNAAKHANCRNIWIELTVTRNKFIMHIKDDGVGFDIENYMENGGEKTLGGNGLLNIQKRAEELHATLKTVSKHGQGTEYSLEIRLQRHPLN